MDQSNVQQVERNVYESLIAALSVRCRAIQDGVKRMSLSGASAQSVEKLRQRGRECESLIALLKMRLSGIETNFYGDIVEYVNETLQHQIARSLDKDIDAIISEILNDD